MDRQEMYAYVKGLYDSDVRENSGLYGNCISLREKYRAEEKEIKRQYEEEKRLLDLEYERKFEDTVGVYNGVSFAPLVGSMLERNLSIAELCKITGVNKGIVNTVIKGQFSRYMNISNIASLAIGLRVPFSKIISFSGYEVKEEYRERYTAGNAFSVPDEIQGIYTYRPLFEMIRDQNGWKKTMKRHDEITELFDKVIDDRSNKPVSNMIRSRIRTDKSINIAVLYSLCKACKCSVDYVIEWY